MGAALEFRQEGVSVPTQFLDQSGMRRVVTIDGEIFEEPEKTASIGVGSLAEFAEDGDLAFRGELGEAFGQHRQPTTKTVCNIGRSSQTAIDELGNASIRCSRCVGAGNDQVGELGGEIHFGGREGLRGIRRDRWRSFGMLMVLSIQGWSSRSDEDQRFTAGGRIHTSRLGIISVMLAEPVVRSGMLDAMRTTYNQIAGRSVERLAALSDGVFAVAMTLLVLDLRAPASEAVHSEQGLWAALSALTPKLLMYMMTFMTLGIFWVGQQSQLNHLARSDRGLSWIHLVFLFAVSVTPFSTTLLADFTAYRTALFFYWLNILLLGLPLYFSWICAIRTGLIKEDLPAHISTAIKRRILIAQACYAAGALLSLVNTYWSITFIILVQLNYAIAPRLPWRNRRSVA